MAEGPQFWLTEPAEESQMRELAARWGTRGDAGNNFSLTRIIFSRGTQDIASRVNAGKGIKWTNDTIKKRKEISMGKGALPAEGFVANARGVAECRTREGAKVRHQ
jgi:hypothetical protein